MTISVLVPVRNGGPALRARVAACLEAVSAFDVELVILDNMSIDGGCRDLPRDVLIVRTERVESALGLLRLGSTLARGSAVVWMPGMAKWPPANWQKLMEAAWNSLDARTSRAWRAFDSESVPEVRIRASGGRQPPVFSGSGQGTDAPRSLLRNRLVFHFRVLQSHPLLFVSESRAPATRWQRAPVLRFLHSVWSLRKAQVLPTPLAVSEQPESRLEFSRAGRVEPTNPSGPVAMRGISPKLSVIITAHNEGPEVLRTVESVRAGTRSAHEIIVVDDGSVDGSCLGLESLGVRVVRNAERVGVAHARIVGTGAASGDAYAYLDAHQRVEPGSLDRCAELALASGAITCPPCRPLHRRYPVTYGANLRLCPDRGFFSAVYRCNRPRDETTRISALRSPAYVVPRQLYERIAWSASLRGWGATDLSVSVKAFFSDVDILHVKTKPTQHLFRKHIPYGATWEEVWRNHALIARVCFDERTWVRYWLPEVFQDHLSEATMAELESPAVLAERDAFHAVKARPDREFWRGILHMVEPEVLV